MPVFLTCSRSPSDLAYCRLSPLSIFSDILFQNTVASITYKSQISNLGYISILYQVAFEEKLSKSEQHFKLPDNFLPELVKTYRQFIEDQPTILVGADYLLVVGLSKRKKVYHQFEWNRRYELSLLLCWRHYTCLPN